MRSTERNDQPVASDTAPASVVARVAAVLGAYDDAAPVLGVSELARRTGLAKSTVHRLVGELVTTRFLDRDESGDGYRLGHWLFEIGELVPSYRSLVEAALPVMEDLREATRWRVHLAVLDGIEVVYVAILGTAQVDVMSRPGGRLPAHATGVGKAILAYSPTSAVRARCEAGLPALTPRTIVTPGALVRELRTIRTEGTSYDREESKLGVSCVAAPVFGSDRKVVAGLSVTGKTGSGFDAPRYGVAVRTAAFTLGRLLRQSGL